ncbi:MAG TPA: hypothetical protein DIV86_07060 [Alphaproteobacteria bacterium]|nr:hypothetical protein [Alphaproteobacteria bacterium]
MFFVNIKENKVVWKILSLCFVIALVTGCQNEYSKGSLAFNTFNYKTWEGAKLRILDKKKKDTGYYLSTRGPRAVLKKKLNKDWEAYYYNKIWQRLYPGPPKAIDLFVREKYFL